MKSKNIVLILLSTILLSSCFPSYLINRRVGKNKFEKIKEVQAIISNKYPNIKDWVVYGISNEREVKYFLDFLTAQEQKKITLLLEEEIESISIRDNKFIFEIRKSYNNPFIYHHYQTLKLIYCIEDNCQHYNNSSTLFFKKLENNWLLILEEESNTFGC